MGFVRESALLLVSFVILFLFRQADLSSFIPQVIGALVFVFIILSATKKAQFSLGGEASVFALNIVVFLIIFATGGLSSSFFFVLYFLVFAIAFVMEPHLAFVFAAGSLIIFLPEVFTSSFVENALKVASLFIISPLAYFFGNMFKKDDQKTDELIATKERAQDSADTISKDVEEVLQNEKGSLKSEDVEKLSEVLEETEDLRRESKE